MHKSPAFIAPQLFDDPTTALAQVQHIYRSSVDFLRSAMHGFVSGTGGEPARVRACYPFVRLHSRSVSRRETGMQNRLSYGFVAGPGRFETTLTRPDLYADYYLEQFRLLLDNHDG